jgi:hypothetical protein
MRSRLAFASGVVAVGFLVLANPADAGYPHDRNGFFLGFGLGGGSAEAEDQAGSSGSDGGVGANFRIGGAVTSQVTLGFETSAWVRREEFLVLGQTIDATTTLSVGTFGVTWYPSTTQGFYVKGGLGFGQAELDFESGGASLAYSENGFGFLAGVGWEWRLTEKFALGPQLTLANLSFDSDLIDRATWTNLTCQLNWYW